MSKLLKRTVFLSLVFAFPSISIAQDFSKKTINIVVGFSAGGGYDVYSRVIARFLPRHIPGQPAVVVQNMPGAGSNKATSFIYSLAPADGTAIGAVAPGAIVAPLLDPGAGVTFDPTKLIYLGSADSLALTCVTLKSSKVQSFEDTRTKPSTFGAVSSGSSTFDYAWLHRKTSNARFEIISGYPGTSDIALAMERGEVDGVCGMDWSSFKSLRPDWLRDKKANVIVQITPVPNAELNAMDVPEIWKYVDTDRERKIVELVAAQQLFGRPYIIPPTTPPAIAQTLRLAFEKVLADSDFLQEAAKVGLSITAIDGNSVQAAVEKMFAAPRDLVDAARGSIKP